MSAGDFEPFVESTIAAAICRLERVEKRLHQGGTLTPVEMGRAQASVLIAIEHLQCVKRMLGLNAPPKDHAPTLRLVRK